MLRKMKFWQKMLAVSLIPLLITGVLIGTLSFNRARDAARQAAQNNLADAVNRVDISLTLRTRQLGKVMETLEELLVLGENPEVMQELCVSLLEPFQEVRSLAVFDEAGRHQLIGIPKTDRQDWVKAIPGKNYWSRVPEKNTVLLCRAAGSVNNIRGVLVLELDAKAFGGAVLQKQELVKGQRTILLDERQETVYADTFLPDGIVESAMTEYQVGRRQFFFESGGVSYFCSAQYNGMVGWLSLTVAAEESLFPGAQGLRRYIVILVAGSLAVASLLLMVLSRLLTNPLKRLSDGMERVIDGDFQTHLDNRNRDEIGRLTDSFNYMVEKIRTLINRVYREQLAQKTAEMEALQAQINPHFLYNSLDSINWMLIERDQDDISRVVVALGKLMQYSMDTRNARVPLREEYRNVRDYLLIQQNRLEDQLDYRLELEPELEEFVVPKLILRPLVENAIKHGVLESHQCCLVTVRAYREDDWICVQVIDDGAGMNEAQLMAYRELLRDCPATGNHIGVRNMARRLQLHFNERCQFTAESTPGGGTTLTLKLPIIPEEEIL